MKQNISREKNRKSLLDTIKERRETSKNLNKVRRAYALAKSKEIAKDSITSLHDNIVGSAKNFGVKIEERAKKYDQNIEELNNIEQAYAKEIENLRAHYDDQVKHVEDYILDLEKQKDEVLATKSLLQEEKDQYIENHFPDISEKLNDITSKIEDVKAQALEVLEQGDFDTASALTNECQYLRKEHNSICEKYDSETSIYDKNLKAQDDKYMDLESQIAEAKALIENMERDYETSLDFQDSQKQKQIATLEDNKLSNKVKNFFSKTILNRINGAKKFKANVIEPFGKSVKDFTDSVPGKIDTMKTKFSEGMQKVVETGKDIKDSAIDKVNESREAFYENAIGKLEASIEKKTIKAEKLNAKLEDLKNKSNEEKETIEENNEPSL